MRCLIAISTGLLLTLYNNNALAWNFQGHVLISEMAYRNLTPATQHCITQYTTEIEKQLSPHFKKKLTKRYPHASIFAISSTFADTWRSKSLKEIFQRFHATLPASLTNYADNTTATWHFLDQPYPHQCTIRNDNNVANMIAVLQNAWQQDKHADSRAVILMLLTHLVADIHQPLHTMSHTNRYCQTDHGGNDYHIRLENEKKATSLHQLWDSGFNYLNKKVDYHSTMIKPIQSVTQQSNNPYDWAADNLQYADFIYSTPENKIVSVNYYRHGQVITQKQIALASSRLIKTLDKLCGNQQ